MAPAYSYEKQQIKLFLQKSLLIDKLNYKITSNMSNQIGLIYSSLLSSLLPQGSTTMLLFLSFLLYQGLHKQAISFSRRHLYNPLV